MRFLASVITAASILSVGDAASISVAPSSSQTIQRTSKSSPTPTKSTTFAPTGFTNTSSGACASVSSILSSESSSEALVAASTALDCLKSVPLNVYKSVAFIEFIEPYIEFQSTLAYLKNPPSGWLFPGVDVLGGLAQIKELLISGGYKTQWDFEKDIWSLVNILPHDFHFNLPLPLISVFEFGVMKGSLVSVSNDGLSLPKVFFKADLDRTISSKNASFTPSAITKINGQDANTFLQKTGQILSDFNDPDATYNQLFFSPAFNTNNGGNLWNTGQVFGFTSDFYNYTFENGTTHPIQNVAVARISFDGINSGQALFDTINPPPTTTTEASTPSSTAPVQITTTTSLVGYPTPIVIHRDGYTSGYFLPNSSVAVLAMQGFIDPAEQDEDAPLLQSEVVASFLASCLKYNKTKLIVDVQGNGGGAVKEGYDTFQRIFPKMEPFGASRMRSTEVSRFLGDVYTENIGVSGEPDTNSEFEAQTYTDVNGNPFANWSALDPPNTIYNDTFTAQTRFNTSYLDLSRNGSLALGSQVFESKNIVLLYDGSCGSTCAIFSEFMKSQGGVRSVVMGGRPQTGPMQGVAGSKGAEVLTFGQIDSYTAQIPQILTNLTLQSLPVPTAPSLTSLPLGALVPWPLGDSSVQGTGSRFNFRNNMHQNDTSFTPLQFIYEASNCRLFYKKEDMYNVQGLWERVENTVWGNGKCVEGSTTTGDRSFPSGAGDTVAYSSAVDSQVVLDSQPGLISGSGNGGSPYSNVNGTLSTITASVLKPTSMGSGSGGKATSVGTITATSTGAGASGTSVGSAVTAQFNGEATGLKEARWMIALVAVVGVVLI